MSDTISLQLAQRFKKAGIIFECRNYRGQFGEILTQYKNDLPAPTAEELWARLPEEIEYQYQLFITKHNNIVICMYRENKETGDIRVNFKGPTLADALGEMYLYLVTNGLIGKDD